MPYIIAIPQPQPLYVQVPIPGASETVPATLVQLDTGQDVALGIHCRMMHNTSCLRIDGCALLVDATGHPILDANGNATSTGYGATLSAIQSADPVQVKAWQQNVALALLGEALTLTTIKDDPNVPTASIRHAIAAAAHAGSPDLSAIL